MTVCANMTVRVSAFLWGVTDFSCRNPLHEVWSGLHRKRLTDHLLTWTAGQREEGRRDTKRKGGVDTGKHEGGRK